MLDEKVKYSKEALALMAMEREVIPAALIAPIVETHSSQIINDAKNGTWDRENNGNYIIISGRVKFFRIDFLRKNGLIPWDKKEDSADVGASAE